MADAASIKLPRRIPYHVAMEMLFTGRRIDAAEAKHWGLINEIVPADQLMARARELADQLADGPPLVFAAIKEITRETAHLPVQQAFDMVTKRKLQDRRQALFQRGPARGCARLRREAQAAVEGPLKRIQKKPRR